MKQSALLAFLGGALAGAAIALLLAPDSGANIRKRIREEAEKKYEYMRAKSAQYAGGEGLEDEK